MVRAVVHGSTFSKNDLAMAAGLATLQVIVSERLIERSAQLGERLLLLFRRCPAVMSSSDRFAAKG
jgi:ornithine--oxo-acid transaminase